MNYQTIQKLLNCQPEDYFLPSPPTLSSGSFSLKHWWSKAWHEVWRQDIYSDDTRFIRQTARRGVVAGLCVGPGYVRGYIVEGYYAYSRYSSQVDALQFTRWTKTQIAEVMGYFKDHPLQAARLLNHQLDSVVCDHIQAHNIPFFENWITSGFSLEQGVLAYVFLMMLEADPLWLFTVHGFSLDNLLEFFGENKRTPPPTLDDDQTTTHFWLGKPLPPMPKMRRPLLSRYLHDPLPKPMQQTIQQIIQVSKQASRQLQQQLDPLIWDAAPIYPQDVSTHPIPKLEAAHQQRFDDLADIIRRFCEQTGQSSELQDLAQRLTATALTTPNARFIYKGFAKTWACTILAMLLGHYDVVCDFLSVSPNTTENRVRKLQQALHILPLDRRWMTPEQRKQDYRNHIWRNEDGMLIRHHDEGNE